ncbi:MAG: hypothetical protein M0R03_03510 [Novosphingobium sp.]|nr:hypothetical protein [Novosphingobium sp.]
MYWRSEKELIEEFTSILRRIFTYVEQVENKDRELITLPTGSLAKSIFESFSSTAESYPQIQVDSGGLSFTNYLNNLISEVQGEESFIGNRPLESVIVTDQYPLQVKIPTDIDNMTIRGISIPLSAVDFDGGENVTINLYKDFTTTPVLMSSGSLYGNPSTTFLESFAEIYPQVTIQNDEDWWMEIVPAEDNKYLFGIDPTVDNTYIYYNNGVEVQETGSLYGSLLSPSFIRVGGKLEGTILIKCSAKGDSSTARDIASIVSIYCELLKQSQIYRKSDDSEKLRLIFGSSFEYDEWLERGIRIKSIRQLPINKRVRSSKDIIYESIITIDILTEWYKDFSGNSLKEIDVNIRSLLPQEFQTMNIIVKDS